MIPVSAVAFLRSRRSSVGLAFLLSLTCVASICGAEFEQPEPLEPSIAESSTDAADSMQGIRIPDGWKIDLFAAEPDVANVVAFDIDNQGRVFVCETFRQNRGVTDNRAHDDAWVLADLSARTVQDRIDYHKRLLGEAAITYAQHDDRIRMLVDTDGDGRADSSTLVVNGFNRLEEGTGAGLLVRGNDIYYTNIPKLWKLVDEDGDGEVDERVVLSDGYGVRVAFRGHDMHGLVRGPDGRLYFSIGDRGYNITTEDGRVLADPSSGAVFRCELDGGGLEVVATGLRNPQELAFNDFGDFFSVDNNSDSGDKARIVQILKDADSGWRMHYQYLGDRGPFNREKIWEPLHPQQPAYIVPPIANFTDGPSGLAYYPGTGFGEQLRDNFLICDFRGGPANSGIRSFKLSPDGAYYQLAADSDPIWTVLATDVTFGPDGALYISDWVDGWDGLGKARMYRLTDPKQQRTPIVDEVKTLLASDWNSHSVKSLTDWLGHADRRIRLESQWELARRNERDAVISVALDQEASANSRLHAVWACDQIARHDESGADRKSILSSIRTLLSDAAEADNKLSADFKSSILKLLGERGDRAAAGLVQQHLTDRSDRVKYFAAVALSDLQHKAAFDDIVNLLESANNEDPALRHAGIMYLSKTSSAKTIASLAKHENAAVRRAAVVALRRLGSDSIADFLTDKDDHVVAEAARAIHDLPIRIAMKPLAMMLENLNSESELTRRVINTNYRLGTEEAAKRLASFASRSSVAESMRIEALQALADWNDTDPRDRVLNEFRPLSKRTTGAAKLALQPQIDLLMTSRESVREEAIDVASSLGIKKIVPFLVQRASDDEARSQDRANALTALARLDSAVAVKIAKQVKLRPTSSLVSASLQVLAQHDKEGSLPRFIEATSSRDGVIGGLAWDILASIDAPASSEQIAMGVQKYLSGELAAGVHLNVLEAAKGRVPSDLETAIAKHQAKINDDDPLGPWLTALEGGDVSNGSKLFFEKTELSCVRCHKVDRAGGEVGPNLTVIGKTKDRRYLLEAITLPNAQIAKGFETAIIANDSGEVFTGIVKSESDEVVELIQSDGSLVKVYNDEILVRKKGKSSMPADLMKWMTQRELRDMVAYLASLQVDRRSAEDVE